jgi:hypothetical protein
MTRAATLRQIDITRAIRAARAAGARRVTVRSGSIEIDPREGDNGPVINGDNPIPNRPPKAIVL